MHTGHCRKLRSSRQIAFETAQAWPKQATNPTGGLCTGDPPPVGSLPRLYHARRSHKNKRRCGYAGQEM